MHTIEGIFIGIIFTGAIVAFTHYLVKEISEVVDIDIVNVETKIENFEDPEVMFNKIINTSKMLKGLDIKFVLEDSPAINAYAKWWTREVIITTGLLEFAESNDEIATIIGHEIGHIVLMLGLGDFDRGPETEYKADKLGIIFADAAGYKGCMVANFHWRLFQTFGDHLPSSHPQPTERMIKLACNKVAR